VNLGVKDNVNGPLDGCACTMHDTLNYPHVQILCIAIQAFIIDEKL
jgi:hypothetical protein